MVSMHMTLHHYKYSIKWLTYIATNLPDKTDNFKNQACSGLQLGFTYQNEYVCSYTRYKQLNFIVLASYL